MDVHRAAGGRPCAGAGALGERTANCDLLVVQLPAGAAAAAEGAAWVRQVVGHAPCRVLCWPPRSAEEDDEEEGDAVAEERGRVEPGLTPDVPPGGVRPRPTAEWRLV